jgi:hypothetical protein
MNIKTLTIFVLSLALSSCAFMEVEDRYAPGTPFSSYKNYHWVQAIEEATTTATTTTTTAETETAIDENTDKLIRSKINQALANKGFKESLVEKPDFLINYQFITQQRTAVNQPGRPFGHLGYKYAVSMDVESYSYRTGSLILDVIDPQSKEVVWQGHVYGFMDVNKDPKKQQERLDKAIRMLVSKFPPKQ